MWKYFFQNKFLYQSNKITMSTMKTDYANNDDFYLCCSAVWSKVMNNSCLLRVKQNSKPQVINRFNRWRWHCQVPLTQIHNQWFHHLCHCLYDTIHYESLNAVGLKNRKDIHHAKKLFQQLSNCPWSPLTWTSSKKGLEWKKGKNTTTTFWFTAKWPLFS